MKYIMINMLFFTLLLFTAGCQESSRTVQVHIEGTEGFAPQMVGTWRAPKEGWELVFEPNGRVSSAVITLGRIEVEPGKKKIIPLVDGGQGVVEPGLWKVEYITATGELSVEIAIDFFKVQRKDQIVEGSSRDIFVGPVSEDGQLWEAEWISFPEYIVSTSEHEKYRLPLDESDYAKGKIVFEKIDE